METWQIVAGVAVAGVVGYVAIKSLNRDSQAEARTTINNAAPGGPLGETGGIIFASLTGLGNAISSITRAANSGSRNSGSFDWTRPAGGAGYGAGTQFTGASANPFDYMSTPAHDNFAGR